MAFATDRNRPFLYSLAIFCRSVSVLGCVQPSLDSLADVDYHATTVVAEPGVVLVITPLNSLTCCHTSASASWRSQRAPCHTHSADPLPVRGWGIVERSVFAHASVLLGRAPGCNCARMCARGTRPELISRARASLNRGPHTTCSTACDMIEFRSRPTTTVCAFLCATPPLPRNTDGPNALRVRVRSQAPLRLGVVLTLNGSAAGRGGLEVRDQSRPRRI